MANAPHVETHAGATTGRRTLALPFRVGLGVIQNTPTALKVTRLPSFLKTSLQILRLRAPSSALPTILRLANGVKRAVDLAIVATEADT